MHTWIYTSFLFIIAMNVDTIDRLARKSGRANCLWSNWQISAMCTIQNNFSSDVSMYVPVLNGDLRLRTEANWLLASELDVHTKANPPWTIK